MDPLNKKSHHFLFNFNEYAYPWVIALIDTILGRLQWKGLIESGHVEILYKKFDPEPINNPDQKLEDNLTFSGEKNGNLKESASKEPDFDKSTIKEIIPQVNLNKKHTLDDVIGLEKVTEIFRVFANYYIFKAIAETTAGEIPKGYLLHGPPGVGKTYAVLALKNEASLKGIKINVTSISPATHGTKYINEFSNNIFDEHEKCKKRLIDKVSDAEIIFLDEASDMLRREEAHKEDSKVANTLNELIDGDLAYPDIYFVACTNRIDLVDSCFVRGERLVYIECPPPTEEQLNKLFSHYGERIRKEAKIPFIDPEFDYAKLTKLGFEKKFNGSDVSNIYNTAINHVNKILYGLLSNNNEVPKNKEEVINKLQELYSSEKNINKTDKQAIDPPKIRQKDLEDLIINYSPIIKGIISNTNPIGFNPPKDDESP